MLSDPITDFSASPIDFLQLVDVVLVCAQCAMVDFFDMIRRYLFRVDVRELRLVQAEEFLTLLRCLVMGVFCAADRLCLVVGESEGVAHGEHDCLSGWHGSVRRRHVIDDLPEGGGLGEEASLMMATCLMTTLDSEQVFGRGVLLVCLFDMGWSAVLLDVGRLCDLLPHDQLLDQAFKPWIGRRRRLSSCLLVVIVRWKARFAHVHNQLVAIGSSQSRL